MQLCASKLMHIMWQPRGHMWQSRGTSRTHVTVMWQKGTCDSRVACVTVEGHMWQSSMWQSRAVEGHMWQSSMWQSRGDEGNVWQARVKVKLVKNAHCNVFFVTKVIVGNFYSGLVTPDAYIAGRTTPKAHPLTAPLKPQIPRLGPGPCRYII
jgi:hypothetical protein